MKTEIINRILSENELTKTVFLGAYPCDVIGEIHGAAPYAIIVNTDNSKKVGSHWTLVFFSEENVYFFDSFGRNFDDLEMFPRDFVKYMKIYIGNKKSKYNPKIVQSLLGDTCAEYCMYWLVCRCMDVTNILKPFSNNLKSNDFIVKQFVNNL